MSNFESAGFSQSYLLVTDLNRVGRMYEERLHPKPETLAGP